MALARPTYRWRLPHVALPPKHLEYSVLGVLAAAAGLAASTYRPAAAPQTLPVGRQTIVSRASFDAHVAAPPTARADVHPPFFTSAKQVAVKPGMRVQKGQVLLELAHPAAEAAYKVSLVSLKKAKASYLQAEREHAKEVAAAKAQVTQAQAAAQQAQSWAPAGFKQVAYSDDIQNDPEARAERQAAEGALQQVLARRRQALAPYEQQMKAAQTDMRAAKQELQKTRVVAPISGTVVALNARKGHAVVWDGKTPLVSVAKVDQLYVEAPMKPEWFGQVKRGRTVDLTVAGTANRTYKGVVEAVKPVDVHPDAVAPAFTPHTVIVRIRNPKAEIRPGMQVRASIPLATAKDVIAVPVDAFDVDNQGKPLVTVRRNGAWQQVKVETGLSNGTYTEVRSGLQEGDVIQLVQR